MIPIDKIGFRLLCDPTTLAIMSAAGGTMQAGGQYISAISEAESLEYQAAELENEARISDIQAQDAVVRGKTSASRYYINIARLAASQKAKTGAAGVTPDSRVISDIARAGAEDILTIEKNAALEAWGYGEEAKVKRGKARAIKEQAKSTRRLAPILAGSSLISGATQTGFQLGGT